MLPPYNTLWGWVIKRGNPPVIMTDTVTVTYRFPDNTYSVGKSNFWVYAGNFGVDLAPTWGWLGLWSVKTWRPRRITSSPKASH